MISRIATPAEASTFKVRELVNSLDRAMNHPTITPRKIPAWVADRGGDRIALEELIDRAQGFDPRFVHASDAFSNARWAWTLDNGSGPFHAPHLTLLDASMEETEGTLAGAKAWLAVVDSGDDFRGVAASYEALRKAAQHLRQIPR